MDCKLVDYVKSHHFPLLFMLALLPIVPEAKKHYQRVGFLVVLTGYCTHNQGTGTDEQRHPGSLQNISPGSINHDSSLWCVHSRTQIQPYTCTRESPPYSQLRHTLRGSKHALSSYNTYVLQLISNMLNIPT